MPTNRTKRTRDRSGKDGLTESTFSFFWWNGTILNAWGEGKTPEEIRSFWKKHRREILTRFIEKNRLRGGAPATGRNSFGRKSGNPD